ncbi:MAG TPA: hypothetical protein VNT27_07390 [Propionibacteriaceae bacterium]|nr:hypothetical protein [Propionibacteriaceae bacterium]
MKKTRRFLAVAPAVAGLVLLGSTLAYAAPPAGPTRGEANATFQSNFTGGFAIRTHNPEAHGAPGGPAIPTPDSARIYPGEPDLEYCAQGWHVITLGIFDEKVRQALSTVDVQFALDGVSLQTERTAIKKLQHPFPDFSENPLWAVTFGAFLPPGSLSLGNHEIQTTIENPVLGDEKFTTPFSVIAC